MGLAHLTRGDILPAVHLVAECPVKKAEDKICVAARLDALPALSEFVTTRAAAGGLSKELLAKVELVVEEIFTNQVRHAYRGQGGDVEVECSQTDPGAFCVRFTDWGPPFDPRQYPPPDTKLPLDQREPGGLGLHLVRNMASAFDYRREGDRNVVTVCFGRPAGTGKAQTCCK